MSKRLILKAFNKKNTKEFFDTIEDLNDFKDKVVRATRRKRKKR